MVAETVEGRLLLSTYTVNTLSDATNPGAGLLTLRQAIGDANTNTGSDTIAFAPNVFPAGSQQTIALTQGQIAFSDTTGTTTVNGPGPLLATIEGNGASRVFDIAVGATVSISGLTITGGVQLLPDANGNTSGGAIQNDGTFTLNNSVVTGNAVVATADTTYTDNYGQEITLPGMALGGAIASTGPLTITNSQVSGNNATNAASDDEAHFTFSDKTGAAFGGGIYSVGPLILNNDTINNNSAFGTDVNIYNAVDGGAAAGGGVYAGNTVTVTGSTISGNIIRGGAGYYSGYASGGGLFASATLTISNSTVSHNSISTGFSGNDTGASAPAQGGGIFDSTYVSITGSTISYNVANVIGSYNGSFSGGGGVFAAGIADLTQDTIDNNAVTGGAIGRNAPTITAGGGGIYAGGLLTLAQSTVSGNALKSNAPNFSDTGGTGVGGGVDANGGGSITYSTIAHNSATGGNGYSDQNDPYFTGVGGNGYGGGAYATGLLTITNSTLTANLAAGGGGGNVEGSNGESIAPSNGGDGVGGGIFAADLILASSTVTGNSATAGSAGQAFSDLDQLLGSAAPGNASAGGIDVTDSASLSNSIISTNTSGGVFDDLDGTLFRSVIEFNLIGVGQGPGNGVDGNIVGINNPQLLPLGNYGGPTETMPPLPGSPAINSGTDDLADGILTDQRGLPRMSQGAIDIGAVESQPVGTKLTGTVIGTTGSYKNQGNVGSKAFDGNLNTFFDGPDANGDWVGLDLGSAKLITSISYAPRATLASRMIGGVFQASNSADFSSGVVTLFTVTSAPPAAVLTTVAIDNPSAYRYVRYLGPTNGYCNIAEAQFFGSTPATGASMDSTGTLVVNGTPSADTINVVIDGINSNTITTTINGASQTFSMFDVEQIVVNAGAGNDTVTFSGYDEGPDGVTGHGFLAITVNGGDGNDSIQMDVQTLEASPAENLLLDGGAGNDSIFNGQNGYATLIGGDGDDIFTSSPSEASSEMLFGGDGNDTLVTDSSTFYTLFDGGAGVNTVDLSQSPVSTFSTLNLNTTFVNVHNVILDSVDMTIVGSAGNDTITATDAGASEISIIGGGGNDTINIQDAYMVNIDASGAGGSNIVVGNSQFVTVLGGNGNDTINVRGDTNAFVDGGSGYDTAYTDPNATVTNVENLNPDLFVKLTGTVIGTAGSYQNDGNTASKAFDGNLSTFFDAPTANGDYVGLDLGSAKVITEVSYAPRANYAGRMVGGIFQGSNSASFSGAVTLYTITTAPVAGELTNVPISNTTAYRYVRYLAPAGSFGNVAELEFLGNIPTKFTGTVIGTPGSYHNHGTTIAGAFDDNFSTFFDAPDATGDWVGLDLGSAKVVTQVDYAPRSGWESRMLGGEIQASNTANFSSGVVTLYTITSTPTAGKLTTIKLSNTTAYRYYRYIGPANSYCDIAELEFDG